MPNSPLKNSNFTWLRLLLATLLVLGIFFRLVNLDRKVYSYDEGFTSLRVGGYFNQEVGQQRQKIKSYKVLLLESAHIIPNLTEF